MARMPENPLPATLTRAADGTVVAAPVQTDQLHLHRDDVQITHHHYAQPIPTTGAQIGVALAQALGKAAPGLGWSVGGGVLLLFGGGTLAMVLISIAVAALGVALAAHSVSKTIGEWKKPTEKTPPTRGKR